MNIYFVIQNPLPHQLLSGEKISLHMQLGINLYDSKMLRIIQNSVGDQSLKKSFA